MTHTYLLAHAPTQVEEPEGERGGNVPPGEPEEERADYVPAGEPEGEREVSLPPGELEERGVSVPPLRGGDMGLVAGDVTDLRGRGGEGFLGVGMEESGENEADSSDVMVEHWSEHI